MTSVVNNIEIIPEKFDETEVQHFDTYFTSGCGCTRQCHTRFPKEAAFKSRLDSLRLDQFDACHVNHQHLILLGTLNALMKGQETKTRRSKTEERKNARTAFYFRGQPVCQRFFLYVNGAGIRRLKNIQQQFQAHGLQVRPHETAVKGKGLNRLCTHQQHYLALVFIQNFAEANGLQLFGRWQASTTTFRDLYYLPTQANFTRRSVFEAFCDVCGHKNFPTISYSLFSELWQLHFPNILLADDEPIAREPCLECRSFSQNIAAAIDASKMAATAQHLTHLQEMANEIENYYTSIEQCRAEREKYRLNYEQHARIGSNQAYFMLENMSMMHYTIDWYTTLSLPYLGWRDNTSYLENGYKVALLGIAIEPIEKFVIYIVPEFVCHAQEYLGNITLSLLDHFHQTYHYNEKETFIHFTNSSTRGPRNSLLLSYWMWRTFQSEIDRTMVSYLPEAHAHSWNDLLMGALRKKLRSCQLSSLVELKTLIERCFKEEKKLDSKIKFQIDVHLVGDDDGQVCVPLNDWQQKLAMFHQLNSDTIMIHMRHFEINSRLPGLLLCRRTIAGEVLSYKIFDVENLSLMNNCGMESFKLTTPPMSEERRIYLHKNIIPLLSKKHRDLKIWNFGPLDIENEYQAEILIKKVKSQSKTPCCLYCGLEGHREATFGRVSCPQKKIDSQLTETSLRIDELLELDISQDGDDNKGEIEMIGQSPLNLDGLDVVIEEPGDIIASGSQFLN